MYLFSVLYGLDGIDQEAKVQGSHSEATTHFTGNCRNLLSMSTEQNGSVLGRGLQFGNSLGIFVLSTCLFLVFAGGSRES